MSTWATPSPCSASRLRVVGLSSGGSSITNTTVFVARTEFANIRGDRVSYLLVGTEPARMRRTVADRISAAVPGGDRADP